MARFFEKILGCRNEGIYRVFTLFGIKFRRKNTRVQLLTEIRALTAQCANLAASLKALSDFSLRRHEDINTLLTKGLTEINSQLKELNEIAGANHQATMSRLGETHSLLQSHGEKLEEFRGMQEEVNKRQEQGFQETVRKLDAVNDLLKAHGEVLEEFRGMQEEVNGQQEQSLQETARKLDAANDLLKAHGETLEEFRGTQEETNKQQRRNHNAAIRKLDKTDKLLKSHSEILAEFRAMQAEVSRVQGENRHATAHKLDEIGNLLKSHAGLKRRLSNLKYIIEAQTLHMQTFAPYKNAFKDEDVVLVCTGPTARYYAPIKNAIHVGVNGAIYLEWLKLDYLFIQDYTIHQEGNENLVEDALSYRGNNCKKFFGVMPSERLAELQKYIGRIPLRYTDGANTCQYLLEDMKFHEIAYDLAREPLGEFGGTVFSALQFILYTNPKTLYIVGWDCGSGYAYNKSQCFGSANYQLNILKQYFLPFIENQHSDLKIITFNPVGLKDIFTDMYTEGYLHDHPEVEESVTFLAKS